MKRINAIFSSKRGSQFRQNFVRIAKANIFAQLLLLAFIPLLTRIYGPEAFGIAALFTSALQIASSICTWRFDRILPNTRNRQAAAAVWAIGAGILSLVVISSAIIFALSPSLLNHWHGYTALGSLLLLLPIALLGNGAQHLFRGWYAREGDLSTVSTARILQSCAYLFVAIVVGIIGFHKQGLVLAASITTCVPIAILWKHSGSLQAKLKRLNKAKLLTVSRKHISQATMASIVSLVNVTSLTAPILLLSQQYSAVELGWYGLMYRTVTTPLGTIMNALSISFWSRSAGLIRENKYDQTKKLYVSVTIKMLIPAVLIIIFAVIAPYFIPTIFGPEWKSAGPVLQATLPMLIGYALFSATNHLIALEKQGLQLIADGLRLCLMLLSMLLAYQLNWEFENAVLALSVSSLCGHLCLFTIHMAVYRQINNQRLT